MKSHKTLKKVYIGDYKTPVQVYIRKAPARREESDSMCTASPPKKVMFQPD